MYELKKVLSCFFYPASIVIILCVIFFYYLIEKNKRGAYLFLVVAFITYILSSNFIWKFMICKVESFVDSKKSLDGDVIAVFGGGVSSFYDSFSRSSVLDIYGSVRTFTGYRIYQKRALPIILSGGEVLNQEPFAEVAKNFLLSLGLKRDFIYVDNLSRDTYENVRNIISIAKKNGFNKIIVVSDAIHIPRIILVFKKNNYYDFSFYPSYYICSNFSWKDFIPSDMFYSNIFIHEFLGYIWYSISY